MPYGAPAGNPYGYHAVHGQSPSGSDLHLQTPEEADWYEDRRDRYLADNMFTNVSDLQDLDRLLMLEVLIVPLGTVDGPGLRLRVLPASTRAS